MGTITTHRKDFDDAKKLIAKIEENKKAKEELASIIMSAFTSRSKKIISPIDFLNLLLTAIEFEERKQKLNKLRESYLFSTFKDTYAGEVLIQNFQQLEAETDKSVKGILREIVNNFNRSEKIAMSLYNVAINKLELDEKKEVLNDALKASIIGGHASLLILRDLAKILVGEKVGKDSKDLQKDQDNRLKQRNKLAVV